MTKLNIKSYHFLKYFTASGLSVHRVVRQRVTKRSDPHKNRWLIVHSLYRLRSILIEITCLPQCFIYVRAQSVYGKAILKIYVYTSIDTFTFRAILFPKN